MKRQNIITHLTLIALGLAAIIIITPLLAKAQTNENPPPQDEARPAQTKPNLLRMLDLSQDQIQQIRAINQENGKQMQQANRRQRQAQIALDQAIYADEIDDTIVQTRLKELNQAQTDFARIRSSVEYKIRKVLNPEQLTKFRELRASLIQKKLININNNQNRPFVKQIQKRRNGEKVQ